MKPVLYIIVISISFGFLKCAQQVPPSGGYKDLNPPMLDTNKTHAAIPANFSITFDSESIVLQFNEYFTLDNPNKKVIITPSLPKKPEYRIQGKKLYINLNNELEPNTTYTINFGNTIKDITEGNKMNNFSYIFSTGSFIDSLTLSGNVYHAKTEKEAEGVIVMLFSDLSDSCIYKGKPVYYTKTGLSGQFNLNYLKEGNYKAFALKDENNNFKFDLPNEKIAFLDNITTIAPGDSVERVSFLLFQEVADRQFVQEKKYKHKGAFEIIMNKPSEKLTIKSVIENEITLENVFYSLKRDTITFWVDSLVLEKKSIQVSISDSENLFSDTLKIPINLPKKEVQYPLIFSHNASKGLDPGKDLVITSKTPIVQVDTAQIELLKKNNKQPYTIEQKDARTILLRTDWTEGETYQVNLYPNGLVNLYGATNDTVKRSFAVKEPNEYGSLLIDLTVVSGYYQLQLLKDNNVVSDTVFNGSEFTCQFEQLLPGSYRVKLIFDDNQNGERDTGNYLEKTQPERIEYYDQPINVRASWDIDVRWQVLE